MTLQPGQGLELARHVGRLGLDFLDANTIHSLLGQPGFNAFGGSGADAIQVKAGQFEQGIPHAS